MARTVAIFLAILTCVQLGVLYYVWSESNTARNDLIKSNREGCERSKLDRRDNAKFQIAQRKYINKVTAARSVKEDVKKAARDAKDVFVKTSASLNRRANINCKEAFP